jgi:hypothetical protein
VFSIFHLYFKNHTPVGMFKNRQQWVGLEDETHLGSLWGNATKTGLPDGSLTISRFIVSWLPVPESWWCGVPAHPFKIEKYDLKQASWIPGQRSFPHGWSLGCSVARTLLYAGVLHVCHLVGLLHVWSMVSISHAPGRSSEIHAVIPNIHGPSGSIMSLSHLKSLWTANVCAP